MKSSKSVKVEIKEGCSPSWEKDALIAEKLKLRRKSVCNVMGMLEEGATVPFIARYRKEHTDNMDPDNIREILNAVEELRDVEKKIQTVYTSINGMGKMTDNLETSLKMSTSIFEVDTLFAPFKPGHAGSHAERARSLGLEGTAIDILDGRMINMSALLDFSKKELSSVGEIEKGVKYIIADIVSKDKQVVEKAKEFCRSMNVTLESTKMKEKTDKKETKHQIRNHKEANATKFQQYYDFKVPILVAKPHQVLAVNRGEDLKILSVKIEIPENIKKQIIYFAEYTFLKKIRSPQLDNLVRAAIVDSYTRLIKPALCRQMRSDLTKTAEKASIFVFMSNLRKLLLGPPTKGTSVLGLDPGFSNGCKFSVISSHGDVLETGVAYLHNKRDNFKDKMQIANAVKNHNCEVIAIGNGVACRETEEVVSTMIKQNLFHHSGVSYTIVDECGASIYSVSKEAATEMPNLDPTLRGAVSIARRLQDPLAEMVKIEPQHLGVGMYQHDLNKTKLQTALGSVVEECVSFVGVDLNTCSQCILKKVAGLNAAKAKNILEWRQKNGRFTCRQQLNLVKGLGPKSFEQCAGFVRVGPLRDEINIDIEEEEPVKVTATGKRKAATNGTGRSKKAKTEIVEEWNPLDMTSIHPESYSVAHKLVSQLGLSLDDVGKSSFMYAVSKNITNQYFEKFCKENDISVQTGKLIVDALKRPSAYDFREDLTKPLFRKEVTSLSSLKRGVVLTGRVNNVTHFGAFVDIGVGVSGLLHVSKMRGQVGLGDHIEVKVDTLDLDRKRIGLALLNKL